MPNKKSKGAKKTSVWIYSGTMSQLERFRKGGETWEEFLLRTMRETRTNATAPSVPKRSNLPEIKKRQALWVSTATRDKLNEYRRGNESWDGFFSRLLHSIKTNGVPENPNNMGC